MKNFLIFLIGLSIAVNFLGIFLPETGFDALWYHLTLAKMYGQAGHMFFVPGGLLYYSAMPRLLEWIYSLLILPLGDFWPHFVNFLFGLGTLVVTFLIVKEFTNKKNSLLAGAIFYITPLVGWISISGYVDLPRTFFESVAFWLFLKKKYILVTVLLALAISTKTLAIGSLGIFALLFFWQAIGKQKITTKRIAKTILSTVGFSLIPLLLTSPWFLFAFKQTGFPFYPIGSGILDQTHQVLPGLLTPWTLVTDFLKLTIWPTDPITPIFLLVLPFAGNFLKDHWHEPKVQAVVLYCLFSYLVWWAIPRTGGGRFFLPYVPVWSVFSVLVWKDVKDQTWSKILLVAIVLTLFLNLGLRGVAVLRNYNFFLGKQSKVENLCQKLDFSTSVFVDCDGWFQKNIKSSDLVYIQNIHNLYHVNFPFVHQTWYRGEKVNFLVVQGNENPKFLQVQISPNSLIHEVKKTGVRIYKL